MVLDSGADAIGLNFYKSSPRFVDSQTAKKIVDAVQGKAKIVGLFVNVAWDEIHKAHQLLRFDYVQLHGAESPEQSALRGLPPIIRAFRWPAKSKAESDFIDSWTIPGVAVISGYLVDANISGAFGGTGERTDWATLYPRPAQLADRSLILAGGLTPENVGSAIESTHPDVVDTASGVESSPGKKDANKLKLFVESARAAFVKVNEAEKPYE